MDKDEEYLSEVEDYFSSLQFEIYEGYKSGRLYNSGLFMGNQFWIDIRIITRKYFNSDEVYSTKLLNKEFNLYLITVIYKGVISGVSQIEIIENN